MRISVFISNDQIQVLENAGSGKTISAKFTAGATIPFTCFHDGVVTDEILFTEFLENFWNEHNLPKKEVNLVLDNKEVVTAKFEVPIAKEKDMMEFVKREFHKYEDEVEQIYAYQSIEKNNKEKRMTVIASRMSRSELELFKEIFTKIGVKLDSVQAALGNAIYQLSKMQEITSKTSIVQICEGKQITNLLFLDGTFNLINNSRVFEESGSIGYAIEVARTVSNQLQFMKANSLEYDKMHIYLTGFARDDVSTCFDSITQMNPDLEVSEFPIKQHLMGMAGLIQTDRTNNFLTMLDKTMKLNKKEASSFSKYVLPIGCLVGALAVATVALGAVNVVTNMKLKSVQAYNLSMEQRSLEYDQMYQDAIFLEQQTNAVTTIKNNIDSYPLPDSAVEAVVLDAASGYANVAVQGYEADEGTLKLAATASEVEKINTFIEQLRQQDVFRQVDYTGYAFDDKTGLWNVNVTCILAENAGKGTN